MNILVLYDRPSAGREDELDALVQAGAVSEALRALGHAPRMRGLSSLPDLDAATSPRPDLVFNLVESLGGSGRLIGLVPRELERRGIPFTGSPAGAVERTSNKLHAKADLAAAGIPTPPWLDPASAAPGPVGADEAWIVKSVWEHASLGIEESSVLVPGTAGALAGEVRRRAPALGGEAFGERFIEGREFNLSLLAGPGGLEVLPPAEIDFSAFEPGRRRIVGYRAKWVEGSFEFGHTPRRFAFPGEDSALLDRLRGLALDCRRLFSLRGYARVDFRVDAAGEPWVLEVNANPCLSPDAGFQAALREAGVPFPKAVGRIIEEAGPTGP